MTERTVTGEIIIRNDILADLDSSEYEIEKRVDSLGYTHIKMFGDLTNEVIQRMIDTNCSYCGYLIWHLSDTGEQTYYTPGGGGSKRYEVIENGRT